MSAALLLRSIQSLRSSPSDFKAQVGDGWVGVPQDVAEALDRHSVRTALQLVQFLFTFPSALADELGWHLADIELARNRLVDQLDGKMPASLLRPVARAPRAAGTANPAGREELLPKLH
jgi:hypothetical protein